jgi:hypothetical protein
MKIFTSFLFLIIGLSVFGQKKPTAFEKHVADSLKQQLLGDWYMSGIYTFDIHSKYDYISSPEGHFGLTISEDSILFIQPPERFYKKPLNETRFLYNVTFQDRYLGQQLNLRHPSSKKKILNRFYFEMNGDELILIEDLKATGFSELKITRQYAFNRYFDSLQLETKIQRTWSTDDIKNFDIEQSPDTIVFFQTNAIADIKQFNIKIHREPQGYLNAEIISSEMDDGEGYLLKDRAAIIWHPNGQQLELISRKGTWFFKVISIEDEKLVLVKQKTE